MTPELGLPARQPRLRHHGGGFELLQQALHVVDVVRPALGMAASRITRRAAREVPLGRRGSPAACAARIPSPSTSPVAAEVLARLQLLGRHHLAAVVLLAVVPREGFAQALVHTDIKVGHHKHRRLQPIRGICARCGMNEAFVRVLREQQRAWYRRATASRREQV